MMEQHPVILEYLDEVCRQIRARELRKEIRLELEGHLEELVWEMREKGMGEEEAARFAIEQMGDSAAVASGLNQVHKPAIPWGMLSGLTVLIVVALVTMYAIDIGYASTSLSFMHIFTNKLIYTGIGLLVLAALSRIDYRKLLDYTWLLYGGTLLLMIAARAWGPEINGARNYVSIGLLKFDVIGTSPYLLLVAAAGMLVRMGNSKKEQALQAVLFLGLPIFLYAIAANSMASLFMYVTAYLVLLAASGYRWRILIIQASALLAMMAVYMGVHPFGQQRLMAFLYRKEASFDAGWIYIQIDNAIASAGWWGNGFAAINQRLPNAFSETVFTYIIYSLGWLAGAFVLFSAIFFVAQLVKMALQVRDRYGKMLVCGIGALFAVQFGWNIGMSLGILPIFSIGFPFVSHGGSHLLIQLAAVGTICSVYLRKDMIRLLRAKPTTPFFRKGQ